MTKKQLLDAIKSLEIPDDADVVLCVKGKRKDANIVEIESSNGIAFDIPVGVTVGHINLIIR